MKLALYKGKGNWVNSFIRWWTESIYSHCEIVIGDDWYSSSVQDRGVRKKKIIVKDGNWDFVDITWIGEQEVADYFNKTNGDKYGWISLITSQLFNRAMASKGYQFCSGWCANAVKIPNSTSFSPETLGDMAVLLNKIQAQ